MASEYAAFQNIMVCFGKCPFKLCEEFLKGPICFWIIWERSEQTYALSGSKRIQTIGMHSKCTMFVINRKHCKKSVLGEFAEQTYACFAITQNKNKPARPVISMTQIWSFLGKLSTKSKKVEFLKLSGRFKWAEKHLTLLSLLNCAENLFVSTSEW